MGRDLSLLVKFAGLDKLSRPLRDIGRGSRATSQAIAETRRELSGLKAAQARVAAFKGLENKLRQDSAALAQAKAKTAALRSEIEKVPKATAAMARALAAAERQEAKLGDRHEAQGRELQELARRLEAAGVDVADLGRHEDRLADRIRETTRELEQQREQLARNARARADLDRANEFGSDMRSKGAGMVAAGTVSAIALAVPVKSQMDFETQLTDIGQKAAMSRQQVAAMGREFDIMGPKVAQLPSDLAAGVDSLLGLGLAQGQAMTAIAPIGRAATAYNAEVQDLSAATFSALDNLKVKAAQTGQTLDIMATAGKAGAFEIRDMAQYFPALTASANALGQRGVPAVADLAAALQITRKGAGDSASAANNLQNLMNKINTEDTIKNFKAFGVDVPKALKKAAKEGKSPIEAIAEMTQQATKGDLSKLSFLFGDAQVQAALRPLVQNIDLYRKIRAEALAAQGTVEADFNERLGDGNARWARSMAKAQGLAHRAGRALLPTVNQIIDKVGALADRVSAWADRNPKLAATLAKIAVYGSILLMVLGGLAIAIGSVVMPMALLRFSFLYALPWIKGIGTGLLWLARIFPLFGRGLLMLGGMIARFGMMLLANPVILVITLIIAAIALAAYMIWKHWDKIKAAFNVGVAFLGQAWAKIKSFFSSGVGQVLLMTMPFIALPLLIYRHWGAISGWFVGLWARVKAIFAMSPGQIWQAFKTGFMTGLVWFANLHIRFAQMGANLITGLIRGFRSKVGALKSTIEGVATSTGKWFAKKLGIHSPSRVFMGLGGFVTEGLAKGIDIGGGEPVDRIVSIAKRMTAALAVGAAAPAMAITGGAGGSAARSAPAAPIEAHFHFHGVSAGDAKIIGAEVKRQLQLLQRGQAAGANASYEDED